MDQQQQQIPVPAPPSPATPAGTAVSISSAPQAPSPPNPPATSIPDPNPSPRPALLPPARPPAAFSRPTTSTAVASRSAGIAIGVPAPRPSPPQQTGSFSPSYGHFGGLPRTEPSPLSSNASQVRPSMPGMGVLGSLGSGAQMRPSGLPALHQPKPVHPPMRPVSSPNTQLPSPQSYQGHGMPRMSTSGPSSSPSQSTPQTVHSLNQPWLASGPQGRPPMPTPSHRHPVTSSQPRPLSQPQSQSQQPQQQQVTSLQQQQASSSQQTHEQNSKQQALPPRAPQTITHPQQVMRIPSLAATQQPSSTTATISPPASVQPSTVPPGPYNRTITPATAPPSTETTADGSCNRMLRKRTIHELLNQVDPSENLDPDVYEILMDYADEFIESITTFGCSLAKHRKSATLEAKDILLHLERNWNITLPGFTSDEIKSFRKPPLNDVHRERIAAIKKSALTTEVTASRNHGGQAATAAKGVVKTPANVFGSPNVKN